MMHPISMQWLWYYQIFCQIGFFGVLLHTVRTINVHYINCKVLKNHSKTNLRQKFIFKACCTPYQYNGYDIIQFLCQIGFFGVLLHTFRTRNVHYINCKVLKNHSKTNLRQKFIFKACCNPYQCNGYDIIQFFCQIGFFGSYYIPLGP